MHRHFRRWFYCSRFIPYGIMICHNAFAAPCLPGFTSFFSQSGTCRQIRHRPPLLRGNEDSFCLCPAGHLLCLHRSRRRRFCCGACRGAPRLFHHPWTRGDRSAGGDRVCECGGVLPAIPFIDHGDTRPVSSLQLFDLCPGLLRDILPQAAQLLFMVAKLFRAVCAGKVTVRLFRKAFRVQIKCDLPP